jgi:hypothetical protein
VAVLAMLQMPLQVYTALLVCSFAVQPFKLHNIYAVTVNLVVEVRRPFSPRQCFTQVVDPCLSSMAGRMRPHVAQTTRCVMVSLLWLQPLHAGLFKLGQRRKGKSAPLLLDDLLDETLVLGLAHDMLQVQYQCGHTSVISNFQQQVAHAPGIVVVTTNLSFSSLNLVGPHGTFSVLFLAPGVGGICIQGLIRCSFLLYFCCWSPWVVVAIAITSVFWSVAISLASRAIIFCSLADGSFHLPLSFRHSSLFNAMGTVQLSFVKYVSVCALHCS